MYNKEGLRNCHRPEEIEETGQQNAMCCPGWDPGAEKGKLVGKLVKSK